MHASKVERNAASRVRRFWFLATCALGAVLVALATVPASAQAASRYQPVTANVPVEFAVSGDKASEAVTFTATLEPAEGETVLPETSQVGVTGAGSANFSLSYDEVGEHHYTLTQVAGSAEGWTYDTATYDVTVYCLWEEETDTLFTKTVVRDADGYKSAGVKFENAYDAPEVPATKPSDDKIAQTGDTSNTTLMAGLAGLGVLAVVVGAVQVRRRSE